jgi:hypothetical protein
VRAAEQRAEQQAAPGSGPAPGAAIVLADRALVIRRNVEHAYPVTRQARVTYSGSGYGAGYEQGRRADIGTGRLAPGRRSLTRASRG